MSAIKIVQAAIESKTEEEFLTKLEVLVEDPNYNLDEKILDPDTGQQFTAASLLAFRGQAAQVRCLYELGADVTEIVKGYAMAGNAAEISYYLKEYEEHPFILSQLRSACVVGYVFADKQDLISELHEQDFSISDLIAESYALAGKEDLAAAYYILHVRTFPDQKEELLQILVSDIARSRHGEITNPLFKEALEANPSQFYLPIVQGYARSGRTDKLITYLDDLKQKNIPNFNEICNKAFFDSAAYGHHLQVEELYKKFANKDTNSTIFNGYLSTNNREAAKGFYVDAILQSYLIKRKLDTEPGTKLTREYKHKWLPKFFQKSFKEKEDAVNALEAALHGEKISLEPYLATLRDGTLGKDLRAFIKKGRADYLEINGMPLVGEDGQKIRTVTDFVRAVEKIVNPKPVGPEHT
jgi:hypothetical protein